jgi:hypothetical protein
VINWLKGQQRFFFFFNDVVNVVPVLRGEVERPEAVDFWNWLARRYHAERVPLHRQIARLPMWGQSLIVSLEDHDPAYQPFLDPACHVTHVASQKGVRSLFFRRRPFPPGS